MSKRERITERSYVKLIPQCLGAFEGLKKLEGEVGVLHNTIAKFAADLEALIGTEGPDGKPGAQGDYNEAKAAYKRKKKICDALEAEADEMCATVLSLLKPIYGHRWTSKWEGVGFSQGSLRRPVDPLPSLIEMCGHFRNHPEREVPAYNVTVSSLQTLIEKLSAARADLAEAFAERKAKKAVRDAAFGKLRHRMIELRRELTSLLAATDPRWYVFQLPRPADETLPARVQELAARPGGPGEVIVTWKASSLAEKYRVSTQRPEADPVEAAYTAVTEVVVQIPPDAPETYILVTAINGAGETRPAKLLVDKPLLLKGNHGSRPERTVSFG